MVRFSSLLAAAALAVPVWGTCEDNATCPPLLEFVGRSAKFKIRRGGNSSNSSNNTWMMMEFGRIQELNQFGMGVPRHGIMSLASEAPTFTETNSTMYNVSVRVVNMTVALTMTEADCPKAGGPRPNSTNGSRLPPSRVQQRPGRRLANGPGSVKIQTIIFMDDAEVPYGNYTVYIKKGAMKWNIEATNWPFCSADNGLAFQINIKMPSDESGSAPGKPKRMKEEGEKPAEREGGRKGPPLEQFKADAGGNAGVRMDLPRLALLDGVAANTTVNFYDNGGRTVIELIFPAFNSTLVYDPAVTFEPGQAGVDDATGRLGSTADPTIADATATTDTATNDTATTDTTTAIASTISAGRRKEVVSAALLLLPAVFLE
jgi:hypothetical protein